MKSSNGINKNGEEWGSTIPKNKAAISEKEKWSIVCQDQAFQKWYNTNDNSQDLLRERYVHILVDVQICWNISIHYDKLEKLS